MHTLELWVHWTAPDLHLFYKWPFDALGVLSDFVGQVEARRDSELSLGQLIA